MDELGFKSYKADPDVWMQPSIKVYGARYWAYVLLHVDDLLVIIENSEDFIRDEIGRCFHIKERSIGKPDKYLGNKFSEVTLGTKAWTLSSSQNIQNATRNVENHLKFSGEKFPPKVQTLGHISIVLKLTKNLNWMKRKQLIINL